MIAARSRTARDLSRWFAAGATMAITITAVAAALRAVVGWPGDVGSVAIVALGAPVIAVAAAQVPRLAGLGGRVLVQTLSGGAFALLTAVVYLIVVRGLGNAPTGAADRQVLGLSMVAGAIAAISFVPARRRLLGDAQRMVFGDRTPTEEVIYAFANRLSGTIPMEELLLQLTESLVRTMDLTRADVYTGRGDVLDRAAGVPAQSRQDSITVSDRERPAVVQARVSGNSWARVWLPQLLGEQDDHSQIRIAPIRNAGELLGVLVVERASSAEPFTDDDDRVLADLAREVGLALHNRQLDDALQDTLAELKVQAAELRESRARIVASGDAERRRLERDIHDGAQQNLSALAIELRLAQDLIAKDPSAAADLLDRLAVDVKGTIRELRELAHGIYPPLLADQGLGPALRAAAARSPVAVDVEVHTSERFGHNIEAAVYFCCLEALQNSAKHAPDAAVTLQLWRDGDNLAFRVADDGPGFDPKSTPRGHGLVNMTDRLGAIGGNVKWRSHPGGGVEVTGSVPVSDVDRARPLPP